MLLGLRPVKMGDAPESIGFTGRSPQKHRFSWAKPRKAGGGEPTRRMQYRHTNDSCDFACARSHSRAPRAHPGPAKTREPPRRSRPRPAGGASATPARLHMGPSSHPEPEARPPRVTPSASCLRKCYLFVIAEITNANHIYSVVET